MRLGGLQTLRAHSRRQGQSFPGNIRGRLQRGGACRRHHRMYRGNETDDGLRRSSPCATATSIYGAHAQNRCDPSIRRCSLPDHSSDFRRIVLSSCFLRFPGKRDSSRKSTIKSVARFARTDGPNSPLAKLLRGQRQFNAERGSSSNFRCKVDGSIMQLHDTEGTG
jgi:hypothetical protein